MKKITKVTAITIGILVFLLLLVFALKSIGDHITIGHGNKLVEKVEAYKARWKKLPSTLEDVGLNNRSIDTIFCYQKRADSINYMIWYGTSLGESKIYYSDSRKWEDFYR